jgi:predicted lipid-binding transport protein (Tim44 family)
MALLIGIFSFLILCAVIAIFSCWWIRKRSANTNGQTYERLQEPSSARIGGAAVEQPRPNADSNEEQCPEERPVSVVARALPIIQIPEAEVASEVPEAKVIRVPPQLRRSDMDVESNQES